MSRTRRRWPRRALEALLAGLLAAASVPGTAQDGADAPPAVHDPANPDLPRLQTPAEGLAGLPRDARGRVDWMEALRQGLIKPRADLDGKRPMLRLQLDIVMKNTAAMPHVLFPHEAHSQWLDCGNCHSAIFLPKAGANPVSMAKIFRGQYCGACHGRVAFTPLFDCERCHSLPHGDVKAWWLD